MAKGRRKRKAPPQDSVHSADEFTNPSRNEDIVLLSQPCSTTSGVPSPSVKYIPKFSSKKPKVSKGRELEEHVVTPPKRIPRFSSQNTVGREACPSEVEAGTEEAAIDQLPAEQAGIEVQEEKESIQHAMQESTIAAALRKGCSYGPNSEGSSCPTSPAAAERRELVSDSASAPDTLEDNAAEVDLVCNESEVLGVTSDGTVPHTAKQHMPVIGDSPIQLKCTETTCGAEASSETTVAKLNQFCDLMGCDSDDEEIILQPFFSQQCGKMESHSHELPLSQPAVLPRRFCTPGLALSQAIPVPMGEIVNAVEEDEMTATTADDTMEHGDDRCLQQVPTLQTESSREYTGCELVKGSSDDGLKDQVDSADIGSLLPHIQQVSDYAAVPCSGGGRLDKDGSHGGVVPAAQGNQGGLSLYEGVGEAEGKQKVGGEDEDELHEAEMEADPLLDSLMEDDCVDIDVCQLERQLQLEFPPEPLPQQGPTSTAERTPKTMDVDGEEMNLEASSGGSSASGDREGEGAGFDDSGVKLLQGILTELSSLNCFVMACRRELEATKRQRRQWLRTTARQQHQRK